MATTKVRSLVTSNCKGVDSGVREAIRSVMVLILKLGDIKRKIIIKV